MKFIDIIFIILIALLMILALRKIIRQRKNGICGCGCGGCGKDCCNNKKKED